MAEQPAWPSPGAGCSPGRPLIEVATLGIFCHYCYVFFVFCYNDYITIIIIITIITISSCYYSYCYQRCHKGY